MNDNRDKQFNYSHAYSAISSGAFGVGSNLAWDSYQRELYNNINSALQKQAGLMSSRGAITQQEARALVDQRNRILMESRNKLSPFGRLYSEILKPSGKLPDFDSLKAKKGSIEAVIESVGKTRSVVNRISVVMKWTGRASVIVQIGVSAYVIAEADPDQRARVASGQAGASGGAALLGWGGAWAGCASGALLASPSLTIPIVGEVTEGGACLIGGIVGGFGFGTAGGVLGKKAGEATYDYVTRLKWVSK